MENIVTHSGYLTVVKEVCYFMLQSLHLLYNKVKGYGVMVFKATVNNISCISWRSVLLVEETGVPGENQRMSLTHFIT